MPCNGNDLPCSFAPGWIDVTVAASDANNDIFIYNYVVSAGIIIGDRARVIWDLSDVEPGQYSLHVSLDDGVGPTPENSRMILVEVVPAAETESDRHGFIFSGPIGKAGKKDIVSNGPPVISNFVADRQELFSCTDSCSPYLTQTDLKVTAADPEDDVLTFEYKTDAGQIVGTGNRVRWDLTGVKAGKYDVSVCADDGGGCEESSKWRSVTVTVY